MIRVAVIQRRLAHYRLPFYLKLLKKYPELDLHLYCGYPEKKSGGSGIRLSQPDNDFIRRVKNYEIIIKGRQILFQFGTFKCISKKKYDLVIFEGSLILLSNMLIMLVRKILGNKNILWIKGWPNSKKKNVLDRLMKKGFLKMADHYIGYGNKSISLLSGYGISSSKITPIQNTVDTTKLLNHAAYYSSVKPDSIVVEDIIKSSKPFVFNIGRLIKSKRVHDILDAFSQLKNNNSLVDFNLVIAGNGPELESIKDKISRENTGDIFFIGNISDKDADILFLNCYCCIFPGAVGLSLNQAMAAGRPVICADESGPDTELLNNHENGIKYPKGDLVQLENAIRLLFNNKELADQLGIKARESIVNSATIDNMVDNYFLAIKKVMKDIK